MKQMVGTTTLFKLVLAFTFLFSCFLVLAILYNKIYKMKNEALLIFEKYEGVTSKSIEIVNNYFYNNGYQTKGYCDVGEIGIGDLNSTRMDLSDGRTKYYYCLSYTCSTGDSCLIYKDGRTKITYKLKMFFKFNLPFLGELELFTFKITGETKGIKLYGLNQLL